MTAIDKVQEAWRRAAIELDFEFVAPFELDLDGRKIACHGMVRGFGSAKGTMFMASDRFEEDVGPIERVAKDAGYFFSHINANVYSSFDRDIFIEALADWGWFRKDQSPPDWLAREPTPK